VIARSRRPWLDRLVWRFTAPVYDRLARNVAPGRAWVADSLALSSDDRVLLLGCGTGLDLEYLPTGAEIVAVDRSPAMVHRCRRRAGALGIDIEARVGDARSVASPERSFDAVLVHLLLSIVDDPDAVLAEASRVLVPDGSVSIIDEPKRIHPTVTQTERLRTAGLVANRSASFGAYEATIAGFGPRGPRLPSRMD